MSVAALAQPRDLPAAVVFDLDGTLVDSAPDIKIALDAAFAPLGVAPFPLPTVKTLIGGGAPAAVARAARLANLQLSPADERAALERFYVVYAEASAAGRGLYPGAIDVLDLLTGHGVALGLCTNKSEPITHIALAALEIAPYFRAVVGARDDLPKKPDPAPLLEAIAGLGVAARGAVMVGDTSADIGAARAAGLMSIAIAHGYAKVPIAELGADGVISSLAELPGALGRLVRAGT